MSREAVLEYDQQLPRRSRTSSFLRRHLPIAQATLDALAWIVAVTVATFARYDFQADKVSASGVALVCVLAVAGQVCFGWALGLYRRRYHYGSFDEVRSLALTVAATGLVLMVVVVGEGGSTVPRTVPFVASFLALVAAAAVRYAFRLWQEQRRRPSASTSRRVVVLGAGEAGAQIVRTMLRNPASPYLPVALLDDDPGKRALRLHGVRVEGCRDDLVAVAERRDADAVLLAIPSASGETLRSLAEPAFAAGIDVLVLPPVEELLGTVTIGDIRPMSEADLIERRPVEVDLASITEHLTGRRILVTGAGGSIGSELCRQLDGIRPAALVMLDRDESGLHATQLAIEGRALLDSPRLVVADIRDRGWLLEVFTRHQPEVVFHTAALKHEPLLELHPGEAWKTNVLGTQNVLDAAVASGVQLFVNLSTDKAADPTSVLGASKRITERLTADAAQRTGRPYVSVRFGNVLGSRGSVITTFRAQITAGGPITITHPDATRFFMTVQEAVVLMIQAAALGEPGETMVLDMGTSVRIEHIARRLILQGGRPVEIVYTGLRPGEKLHETLLNSHEPDLRPRHPLISHVCVPPLSLDDAEQVCLEDGSLHPRAARLIAAAQHGAWAASAVANAPTTNERARRGG